MKSMMALSMHKAGSTVANYIFVDILKERGYDIDLISSQVMGSALPEHEIYHQYQSKMLLDGVYYGMARSPKAHTMEILHKMRLVVQVRDPRDCITSQYFSAKASHRVPDDPKKKEEFLARRDRLNSVTIDEFSVAAASGYAERLEVLRSILDSHEDCLLLKYEDMVTDTHKWLESFSTFVDQPITQSLHDNIKGFLNFNVPNEDENRHKRQVKPGDHRRKLCETTVETMNEKLSNVLDSFDYQI